MALCFAWTILGEDHNAPEHVAVVVEVVETHLIRDSPLLEWVVCGFVAASNPLTAFPCFPFGFPRLAGRFAWLGASPTQSSSAANTNILAKALGARLGQPMTPSHRPSQNVEADFTCRFDLIEYLCD